MPVVHRKRSRGSHDGPHSVGAAFLHKDVARSPRRRRCIACTAGRRFERFPLQVGTGCLLATHSIGSGERGSRAFSPEGSSAEWSTGLISSCPSPHRVTDSSGFPHPRLPSLTAISPSCLLLSRASHRSRPCKEPWRARCILPSSLLIFPLAFNTRREPRLIIRFWKHAGGGAVSYAISLATWTCRLVERTIADAELMYLRFQLRLKERRPKDTHPRQFVPGACDRLPHPHCVTQAGGLRRSLVKPCEQGHGQLLTATSRRPRRKSNCLELLSAFSPAKTVAAPNEIRKKARRKKPETTPDSRSADRRPGATRPTSGRSSPDAGSGVHQRSRQFPDHSRSRRPLLSPFLELLILVT